MKLRNAVLLCVVVLVLSSSVNPVSIGSEANIPLDEGRVLEDCTRDSARAKMVSRLGLNSEGIPPGGYMDLLAENAERLELLVFKANGAGTLQLVAGDPSLLATLLPASADVSTAGAFPNMEAVESRMLQQPPPPRAPSAEEIVERLFGAFEYGLSLYKEDGVHGVISEYIGYPLAIDNRARRGQPNYPRLLGDFYGTHARADGKVTQAVIGRTFDWMDVTFADHNWRYGAPSMQADRYYHADSGTVEYVMNITAMTEQEPSDLYLGTTLVQSDLQNQKLPFCRVVSGKGLPSQRYMTRTNMEQGRRVLAAMGESEKGLKVGQSLFDMGYANGMDYYSPMYGSAGWLSDDLWMFSELPYWDCSEQAPPFLRSMKLGYVYRSKVCHLLSWLRLPKRVSTFLWRLVSREDYIATGLTALHVMNRYNDPNHEFEDPRNLLNLIPFMPKKMTTPLEIIRWYEAAYLKSGHGIPYLFKSEVYGSRLRTDIFGGLEAVNGYKFGDAVSKVFADDIAARSMLLLSGYVPNQPNTLDTLPWLKVVRPPYRGAPYLSWTFQNGQFWFARSDTTIVQKVLNLVNQPEEAVDLGPVSVGETTWTYIQFLREYLLLSYGATVGEGGMMLMPRLDTPLKANGLTAISIPYDAGWKAQDLLQELARQGAQPEYVETYWEGEEHRCAIDFCPVNFDVVPGMGVAVWVQNGILFRIPGLPQAPGVAIHLPAEKPTLIGIPAFSEPKTGMYAADLVRDMEKSGCVGVTVYRQSAEGNDWEQFVDYSWSVENQLYAYLVTSQTECSYRP